MLRVITCLVLAVPVSLESFWDNVLNGAVASVRGFDADGSFEVPQCKLYPHAAGVRGNINASSLVDKKPGPQFCFEEVAPRYDPGSIGRDREQLAQASRSALLGKLSAECTGDDCRHIYTHAFIRALSIAEPPPSTLSGRPIVISCSAESEDRYCREVTLHMREQFSSMRVVTVAPDDRAGLASWLHSAAAFLCLGAGCPVLHAVLLPYKATIIVSERAPIDLFELGRPDLVYSWVSSGPPSSSRSSAARSIFAELDGAWTLSTDASEHADGERRGAVTNLNGS